MAKIPKIRAAKKRNGASKARFTTDELRTWFLVGLPLHRAFKGEVEAKVTGEVTRLLRAIQGEMTRQELQSLLKLKQEDHFREAYLIPTIAAGLFEMTNPNKTSKAQDARHALDRHSRRRRQQLCSGSSSDWMNKLV